MGEFQVTEQIISAKQNQNTKEALTRALSILIIRRENRAIVLKPEQEMAIFQSSSKERYHGNFVNRFWQEHDLYFLRYGQRRNALIENLYDLNFSSKKY